MLSKGLYEITGKWELTNCVMWQWFGFSVLVVEAVTTLDIYEGLSVGSEFVS
jgi:hypothetical protein